MTRPGRPFGTPRRRWVPLLVAAVLLGAGLAGVAAIELRHAVAPQFVPATVSISTHELKVCSAATTCTTPALKVVAFSTLVLLVTAEGTVTAPSGVSSSPSYTWTKATSTSSTTQEDHEALIYLVGNVSASSSQTVTVTYAASSTYQLEVADVANTYTWPRNATDQLTGSVSAQKYSGDDYFGDGTVQTYCAANAIVLYAGISVTSSSYVPLGILSTSGSTLNSTTISGEYADVEDADALPSGCPGNYSATVAYEYSATATFSIYYAMVGISLFAASVPAAVTGVSVTSQTTTSVSLSWTNGWGPYAEEYVDYAIDTTGCGVYSYVQLSPYVKSDTVSGLVEGDWYCLFVQVANSTGNSSDSAVVYDSTAHPPPAPTSFSAAPSLGSTTSLSVSWTQPTDAAALVNSSVYVYSGSSCTGTLVAVLSAGTQSGSTFAAAVGGLSANTEYAADATAWNGTGQSSASGCAVATTNALPGAPSSLGASAVGSNTVTLEWVQGSGAVDNDTIDYGPTCAFGSSVSVGIATTATVGNLVPLATYCFSVYAWSAGGAGPLAHPYLNVTTVFGPPTMPSGLTLTSRTSSSLSLGWTQGNPGPGTDTNSTVYWGTSYNAGTGTCSLTGGGAASLGAVSSTTIGSLPSGATFCVAVTSWSQGGQSLPAVGNFTTFAAPPAAPTSLHEVAASRTTLSLAWTDPAGPLVNVTVQWSSSSTCSSGWSYASAGVSTSWTIGGLTPLETWYVEVSAWTAGGEGPPSACEQFVTQSSTPPAPVIDKAEAGATYIVLTWSLPAGYTLFNTTVFYGTSCGSLGTNPTGWSSVVNLHGVTTFYNVTGLPSGTTFCLSVQVWDGPSPLASPVEVTTGFLVTVGGGLTAASEAVPILGSLVVAALVLVLAYLILYAPRKRD